MRGDREDGEAPLTSIDPVAHLDAAFAELSSAADQCLKHRWRVAALVLVYSGMDVAGWVRSTAQRAGRRTGNRAAFTEWVDQYLKPRTVLGCSALELYAARCGIVHSFSPAAALHAHGNIRQLVYAWRPSTAAELRAVHRKMHRSSEYAAIQGEQLVRTYQLSVKTKFLPYLRTLPPSVLAPLADKVFTMVPPGDSRMMLALLKAFDPEN